MRLLDTHLAHEQFTRLTRELAATETELARARAAQEIGERGLTEGEAAVADARAELEDASTRYQEARTAASECRDRLRSAESRREFNRERATESAGLRERYETELAGAEERLRTQEEEMQHAAEEEAQIAAILTEGRERLGHQDALVREARSRRAQAEGAFQNAQRAAGEAERKITALRAELAAHAQQQQAGDVRKEFLAAELARLEPARADADTRVIAARADLAAGQTALEARRQELRAAEEGSRRRAKGTRRRRTNPRRRRQKAQAGRTARLEVLRGLNAAGARGFPPGRRRSCAGWTGRSCSSRRSSACSARRWTWRRVTSRRSKPSSGCIYKRSSCATTRWPPNSSTPSPPAKRSAARSLLPLPGTMPKRSSTGPTP